MNEPVLVHHESAKSSKKGQNFWRWLEEGRERRMKRHRWRMEEREKKNYLPQGRGFDLHASIHPSIEHTRKRTRIEDVGHERVSNKLWMQSQWQLEECIAVESNILEELNQRDQDEEEKGVKKLIPWENVKEWKSENRRKSQIVSLRT